jgi:hypothetical protein
MKAAVQKLVGIYEYHGKFYAFIHGLEGAAVAALTAYFQSGGQLPLSKTALYGLAGFVGKAVYGYAKGYVVKNLGTN